MDHNFYLILKKGYFQDLVILSANFDPFQRRNSTKNCKWYRKIKFFLKILAKVTPNHILDGFLWPKRLPKSSKITPNLNKIGAKNKNVCIHGHYWKKYCDFLCSSTCPHVFLHAYPAKVHQKSVS